MREKGKKKKEYNSDILCRDDFVDAIHIAFNIIADWQRCLVIAMQSMPNKI